MCSTDAVRDPRTRRISRSLRNCGLLLLLAQVASAEVVRIDVRRRDDAGTHERVIGRVHFAIDPKLPANRAIADLDLAPNERRRQGRILLGPAVLQAETGRPRAGQRVPRSRQSRPRSVARDHERRAAARLVARVVGSRRPLPARAGIRGGVPRLAVRRRSRPRGSRFRPRSRRSKGSCVKRTSKRAAGARIAASVSRTARLIPRQTGRDADVSREDGRDAAAAAARHVAVRRRRVLGPAGHGRRRRHLRGGVSGEGIAGGRSRPGGDSRLRVVSPATAQPAPRCAKRPPRSSGSSATATRRADASCASSFATASTPTSAAGPAFDALMISSAGAGGGSFNHRFAMPGVAGNSVLSVLRPVDLPPFTDDGLLASAQAARVTPKIFYTFSSTEYWARAGSLTHTSDDGRRDVPLAPTSRLYFLAGTPHSSGGCRWARSGLRGFSTSPTLPQQRWVTRALLLDLDAWTRNESEPPPSQYPSIAKGELVALRGRPLSRARHRSRLPPTCRRCGGWTTDPAIPRRESSPGSRRNWARPIGCWCLR